jgi:hypothetical protein
MTGGTILSSSEVDRAGIFAIGTRFRADQPNDVHLCTASVLRTSAARSETWLVTAAHCIENDPIADSPIPSNMVVHRNSGFLIGSVQNWGSPDAVIVHPDYDDEDPPLTRAYRDIALIHMPVALPVSAPNGVNMWNWYRPIFAHSPLSLNASASQTAIFGGGTQSSGGVDGSIRYLTGNYYGISEGNIEMVDITSNEPEGGDSGGPWISVFGDTVTNNLLIDHGAILGIHHGEWWNFKSPMDEYAAALFASANYNFVAGIVGDSAVPVPGNTWRRPCFIDWCHYRQEELDSQIAHLASTLLL